MAYAETRALTLVERGARGPLGLSFESLLAVGGLLGGARRRAGAPRRRRVAAATKPRPARSA